MQPIYPIDEATIKPYIGRNLYALTHEEIEAFGKLTRVEGGMLYFNETPPAAAKANKKLAKAKSYRAKRGHRGRYLKSTAGEFPSVLSSPFSLEIPRIAYLFVEDN